MATGKTNRSFATFYPKLVCFHVAFALFFSGHTLSFSTLKSLPGFPGPLPFKLETGYIGVDEGEDVQLFYYFVESESSPRDDPLLLWLSGGPRCSATSGLLLEMGPLRFNMVEYNGSLPTFSLNPHSWTKVSSIIFIDAPVGTGFSYSRSLKGSKASDTIYAKQTCEFLRKWLIKHPEFNRNPLYISGDSYSGMIVPIIVQEIIDGTEAGYAPHMNLYGYLLGNPRTDTHFSENSKIPFAHRMALISDELYRSVKRNCKREYVKVDPKNMLCVKDLEDISKCTERVYFGHVLEQLCPSIFWLDNEKEENHRRHLKENFIDSFLSEKKLPKLGCRNYNDVLSNIWANDYSVQRALNIRKGTISTWTRCQTNLSYTCDVPSVVNYHLDLNARGYRALIYSGDHDMLVPYLGTEMWIKSLNFSIVEDWRPWLVNDQVGGYTRKYANDFTFATVKGAGHTAPEYKPEECFAMFRRWISHEPL